MFKSKPLKSVLLAITFKQFNASKAVVQFTFKHLWTLKGIVLDTLQQSYILKRIAVVVSLSLIFGLTYLLSATPLAASAATTNTINFQARLETSFGSIVPDGTYNIEFKLYNASSSSGSSQGSCTGDTHCLWVEDYLVSASQGVSVANGYLTVNLGSINPFSSATTAINWGQPLYLTINVGGTAISPSWDGEMTPRLPLTSVPAAFALESANAGSFTSTLSFVQPTASESILLPAESGGTEDVCYQNDTACGFAPSTGGTGYIQNTSTQQPSSNFNISTEGQLATLDATGSGTANTLTIGAAASTTGAITIGSTMTSGTVAIGGTTQTGNITVGQYNGSSTNTINIGTNAGASTTQNVNVATSTSGTNAVTVGSTSSTSTTKLQAGATSESLANSGDTIKTTANSTTAFQVQNTASANVLTIDTTTTNLITNPSFEPGTTGWTSTGTGASITQNTTPANSYDGPDSLQVVSGTTANGGAQVFGFTAAPSGAGTWTLSFYAAATTIANSFSDLAATVNGMTLTTGCTLNSSKVTIYGFQRYWCTFTASSGTMTSINIGESGTTSHTFYLDAVQLTATNGPVAYGVGNIQLGGVVNTPIDESAASNAASALAIQNTNAATIFNVGTAVTNNLLPNPDFQSGLAGGSGTGWMAVGGSTTLTRDATQSYSGNAAARVAISTATTGGLEYNLNPVVTAASTTYTVSWYGLLISGTAPTYQVTYSPNGAATSTCTVSGQVGPLTTGWIRYQCTVSSATAPTTSGYLEIAQTDSNTSTWDVDAIQLEQASTATDYSPGNFTLDGTVTSPVAFQNTANSTTAFQVQNASGANVLSVDTTDGLATLGTANSLNGSLVFADSSNANTVTLNVAGTSPSSYTLTLPTAAPSASQCLESGSSTPSQLVFTATNCGGLNLQQLYNNSNTARPTIILNNASNPALTIQNTNSSPISGTLFGVYANAASGLGSPLLTVASTGDTAVTSTDSTGNALTETANSITTGNGNIETFNGLTSGDGVNLSTTSAVQSGSGALLNVSDTATLATNSGTDTGDLVNISRALAANVSGTVTYDGNALDVGTTSVGTSYTNSLTITTNSNLFLFVAIVSVNSSFFSCQQPTSVTYNSVSLGSPFEANPEGGDCTYYYGLTSPSSGSAYNLVVSDSGAFADLVADSFYNVNQTTPYAIGSFTWQSGTSASPSISVPTSTGQAAVDFMSAAEGSSGSGSTTTGSTQTRTGIHSFFDSSAGEYVTGGTSYATVSGSSTTMIWSVAGSPIYYEFEAGIALNGIVSAETISAPVASISNSCTITAGSCTDTTSVLNLNQQYTGATGSVLNVQDSGSGSGINVTANSVTSGTGISGTFNGLTSGYGLGLSTNSAVQTGGSLLNVSDGATLSTNSGNDVANLLNVSRALTANVSGSESVSSPVASFSNSCSITAGSCTDATNVVSINQQYSSSTGTVLYVQGAGSGALIQAGNGSAVPVFSVGDAGTTTLGNVSGTGGDDIAGALQFGDGTTDNRSLTLNTATLSNTYTLSLPASGATGTECLQSSSGSSPAATTLQYGRPCGSGNTLTLQQTYNNSNTAQPTIILNNASNPALTIQNTNSSPISGTLLGVYANAASGLGSSLFTVASTGDVAINSSDATPTGAAVNVAASSTTGYGLKLNANALTTGYGGYLSTTSATQTAGSLLDLSNTATLATNAGSDYANVLNVSRALTMSVSGAESVTAPVASFSNSCAVSPGSCTDATNVVSINQQYSGSTGAVLSVQGAGSGSLIQASNNNSEPIFLVNTKSSNLITNPGFG